MAAIESAWRRIVQTRHPLAQLHTKQAQDDYGRAPDIGAEVERVGLESLAVKFFRRPVEHAGTGDVDPDRGGHDRKRPDIHFDSQRMKQETVGGFVNDPPAGKKKQESFKEAGEIFHLAVTIKMILIRRLSGKSDGQEGHHGSHEIEAGMSCLSKDAQAARGETNDDLEDRQGHGRNNGAQRR